MFSVTLSDFQPINTWTPDLNHNNRYLIDMTTGRKYRNETQGCIRFKCFLLTLGTPIVHSVALLVNIAFRIVALTESLKATGQDLLKIAIPSTPFKTILREISSKKSFKAAQHDLLRIVATPIALVGLELAAIYGIFTPYNGGKLYASIERVQYGDSLLAPCLQPIPSLHTPSPRST